MCVLCVFSTVVHASTCGVGLVSRTLGIMPEKAFKMQGWIIVGRYMEKHFESPTLSKWLVAGAAAGAATTLIGQLLAVCVEWWPYLTNTCLKVVLQNALWCWLKYRTKDSLQ